MRALYSLVHYAAVPFILLRLLWRSLHNPRYRHRWRERFGASCPFCDDAPRLWIHAVSVGEVQAAVPLVRALQARYPRYAILVTTTTPTGAERVAQAFGDSVAHRYMPYDLPGAMRRFLAHANPSLAIIMETELWPNLLHLCRRDAIPVLLANVRLSWRAASGYRRIAALVRGMLGGVDGIAAQSREDAARLIALGACPERVHVTGNLKFDVKLPASLREEAAALRRVWGVDRGIWVAASTHDGEEAQVLDAFARILGEHPDTLLVLVPRHPERFAAIASLSKRRGYTTVMRSAAPRSCADVQVMVGDSMGELPLFYAAADVAFVGGSLVEVGGHNTLEPAALGRPVIMGPHVFNFAEIGRKLCAAGAARRVRNAGELAAAVLDYLGNANLRHAAGEKGRSFVDGNRGALEALMTLIDSLLAPSGACDEHSGSYG